MTDDDTRTSSQPALGILTVAQVNLGSTEVVVKASDSGRPIPYRNLWERRSLFPRAFEILDDEDDNDEDDEDGTQIVISPVGFYCFTGRG